jgi:hypothetical protein
MIYNDIINIYVQAFAKTYLLSQPWSQYVCAVAFQPLYGGGPAIWVGLRSQLPSGLKLPQQFPDYFGLKVVTEVAGEIVPQYYFLWNWSKL